MENTSIIRFGFFFGILVTVALWERLFPRRPLRVSIFGRWFANLGVTFVNPVIVRLLFPVLAVELAVTAQQSGWGLLNNYAFPPGLATFLSVVILDFIIYLQHVMFHAVPLLWRLHMMHHADIDYDVTTGARFHPIEIIISMGIKMAAIVVIGPPPIAVLIFEILLNGTAMFNHGNIYLPLGIDRVLRLLVVTPDMHRVHHSVFPNETNTNFGFSIPWWDRIFGTYRAQPTKGHDGMTIGLNQFQEPRKFELAWMVALPFFGKTGAYAIGRRGIKKEDRK